MAEQLKFMYNDEFIKSLAKSIKKTDVKLDDKNFINSILNNDWKEKELKARGIHIAEKMYQFLPYDYDKQIAILKNVAPNFKGYTGTIFPTFVELYGLEHAPTSLMALETFTQYSTSEFAIRPFLIQNPNTIEHLYKWAESENFHVRRLASEGCRPLLPWAMKLTQYIDNPQPILPILDRLKNDKEDYVYRSVANNWNDISKHHPDLVLRNINRWAKKTKTTEWVAKHALRTLLKQGNQEAMSLFGFGTIDNLKLNSFAIQDSQIEFGGISKLHISIKNNGPEAKFRLEYAIDYLKKTGKHNRKIFQLTETTLNSNQSLNLVKKLDFKDLSTRKHYRGIHFINLVVNGNDIEKIQFHLT
ncbi:DNA alkylation repair protein [Crocinitomix catalasitica]|uniref:DNA alkylation repair protein n=1 Tax=Crocinitomix catalasitica TaxID=184607 RepID=UPI000488DD90|nr:DNA alkylation repair protein [Crocinitomix catalasitica]